MPRRPALICDAIPTPAPGAMTFPVLQRLAARPRGQRRGEAFMRAVALAFSHLRIVLEPGGAVSPPPPCSGATRSKAIR